MTKPQLKKSRMDFFSNLLVKPCGKYRVKRFRDRALQILFTLTLAWALTWWGGLVFAEEIETAFGLMPFPEGSWLHDAVEVMIALVIFAAFAAMAVYCFRRWPWFLRVPESISPAWLTVRLLGYAPLLFAVLWGTFFLTFRLFGEEGVPPEHSQYGLGALFVATFYSIYLTPLFTVVIVWLSALRKHRLATV